MLLDNFDSLLLDLDGVVYRGKEAIPGAVEAINRAQSLGKKIGYITNNASRTPSQIADQLRGFGLSLSDDDIVGSARAGAKLLAERIPPGSKVLVVGGEGLRSEVAAVGFRVVDSASDHPDAVIQGFSPSVGWEHLAQAAFAIQAGATWIATNQDWTIPLEAGIAPGNGTLVGAVHTAVGQLPEFAGKPFRPIFDAALKQLEIQTPLVIGDRLDTDIKGAIDAGLDSACVLTGIATKKELLGAKSDERPNYILSDLGQLFEDYPTIKPTKRGAVCRSGEVELLGDQVVCSSQNPRELDSLRAATSLIWSSGRPIYGLQVEPELMN
ncbi:MAG: haloacid dehalogenase [Candidatus Aquiluna sp. XM-24bin5]|nr:MAG: haloacid dehalogenase [Candidatus Aquiluna sp. XM-24bin5]